MTRGDELRRDPHADIERVARILGGHRRAAREVSSAGAHLVVPDAAQLRDVGGNPDIDDVYRRTNMTGEHVDRGAARHEVRDHLCGDLLRPRGDAGHDTAARGRGEQSKSRLPTALAGIHGTAMIDSLGTWLANASAFAADASPHSSSADGSRPTSARRQVRAPARSPIRGQCWWQTPASASRAGSPSVLVGSTNPAHAPVSAIAPIRSRVTSIPCRASRRDRSTIPGIFRRARTHMGMETTS